MWIKVTKGNYYFQFSSENVALKISGKLAFEYEVGCIV